jgi:hypothetical protein
MTVANSRQHCATCCCIGECGRNKTQTGTCWNFQTCYLMTHHDGLVILGRNVLRIPVWLTVNDAHTQHIRRVKQFSDSLRFLTFESKLTSGSYCVRGYQSYALSPIFVFPSESNAMRHNQKRKILSLKRMHPAFTELVTSTAAILSQISPNVTCPAIYAYVFYVNVFLQISGPFCRRSQNGPPHSLNAVN